MSKVYKAQNIFYHNFMDFSIKNKPTRHYPTGLSAHPYSIYFSTSIFIASEVCPRSDPGLGLSLPTPASKNISLTLLLFIVIIGKNLIQCNGFHAGNHICFQLFVGIIQH